MFQSSSTQAAEHKEMMTMFKQLLAAICIWMLVILAVGATGTVTYVYTDPQGTPLAEADAKGNITATFDYTPYGTVALGSAPNGLGYTGHVNDPTTNLIYMQARYYDPITGRFLSVDPVVLTAGDVFKANRYSYANSNPIRNIDPDGKQALDQSARYLAEYNSCAQAPECNPNDVPLSIATREQPYADAIMTIWPTERLLAGPIKFVVARVQIAREISSFIKASTAEFKGSGLSVAARKIESHSQRIGGTFPKLTGTIAEKNAQAKQIISDILKSPDAVRTELSGGGVEYRLGESGQGVRFNRDGSFSTVLDPKVPKE
jgi:RHS repeat-associated protein